MATAENEGDLLELAQGSTAAELERMVRGWRLLNRKDEGDLERIRHASRTLAVVPDNDGMYVVRGRLDPEVGALLLRAVEAAGDALYRTERAIADGGIAARSAEAEAESTPAQRRADALGLLAERAMAAGFGGEASGASGRAEASSGARAERYQVVLHVEAGTLERTGEPGRSELEDGTRVYLASLEELAVVGAGALRASPERPLGSAETSRRLACDASLVEGRHGPDGRGLDVGRRRRTIPPAIRRALESRDRGCRFPGCGSRFTDAHHVAHWADGGETKLDNLVLVCRVHHRRLHEEGYRLELNPWPGGRPVFYDPRGLPVPEAPPVTDVGSGAVDALVRANLTRGVRPSWQTASCRWECVEDVPLDVVGRAEDAA